MRERNALSSKPVQIRGMDVQVPQRVHGVVALLICGNPQDVWRMSHDVYLQQRQLLAQRRLFRMFGFLGS